MFNKKSVTTSPTPSTAERPASVYGSPASGAGTSNAINAEGIVIVGKGTRIVGEITDCSRLEIQGIVEGNIMTDTLVLCAGGGIKGHLQARHAEIHGGFNGILEVQELLDVRATGRVEGELAYGRLAVAMGGHISGSVIGAPGEPTVATPAAAASETELQSTASNVTSIVRDGAMPLPRADNGAFERYSAAAE